MEKKMTEYFKVNAKVIVIEFDKLFNNPQFAPHNQFRLLYLQKRFYGDTAAEFAKGCNELLNYIDKKFAHMFLYQYFVVKKAIDSQKISANQLFAFICSELFSHPITINNETKTFLDIVIDYVDENYIDHIDHSYEQNSAKFDRSAMFLERHYKILFDVSVLTKFAIPLCIHFLNLNPMEDIDADTFVYNCVMEIMELVSLKAPKGENEETINIYQKLYRIVEKFLQRIEKSDQNGLTRLEFFGISKDLIMNNLMVKLCTNILPKYEFSKDIMKFNQTVIRSTVEIYTIRKEDPHPTKCIISDTDDYVDDEDILELFSRYNKTTDEKSIVYRRILPSITIDRIQRLHNVQISDEEFQFYLDNLEINPLQTTLISQVYSKEFEGAENITGLDRPTLIRAVIILHKRMLRLGLINLANIIIGKKISSALNQCQIKTIVKKVQDYPQYKDIVETRYSFIKNLFYDKICSKSARNHPIIEVLRIILNENYVFNGYNDPDNGKPIMKNEAEIIPEVLNVYTLLIN